MVVKQIGEIADGVYLAVHRGVPVFLVDGDRPALFDAGLAFLGTVYARIPTVLRKRQASLKNREPEKTAEILI